MKHVTKSTARITLSPSGVLHIGYYLEVANVHADVHQPSIIQAFSQSQEQGLLEVLALKMENGWSLALKYWRNYIALYITQLCHHATHAQPSMGVISQPPDAVLQEWALKAPPMPGGEYLTAAILASIWLSFDTWCRSQIAIYDEGVAGF